MEKISPEITTEKIKETATAAIEALKNGALPDNAKKIGELVSEKTESAIEAVKDIKVVSDLEHDIKEKPEKVKREAGIASIAAALTFAGIRIYDSYGKKSKSNE